MLNCVEQFINNEALAPEQNKLIEMAASCRVSLEIKSQLQQRSSNEHYIYKNYRFDQILTLFPFFNPVDGTGLKKMCDHILFVEYKNKLHILLIEIKTGKEASSQQLEASKIFSEFLLHSIHRVNQCTIDKTKNEKVQIAAAVIVKVRVRGMRTGQKGSTKPKPPKLAYNNATNYTKQITYETNHIFDLNDIISCADTIGFKVGLIDYS